MLTNYQYAIPTGMFSRYQAQMRQYTELFTEQKEAAMPKKKFAFVRKKKGVVCKYDAEVVLGWRQTYRD